MPKYGNTSMNRLVTCERSIQTVMHEVIKHYDHTVIYGHRSPDLQFELFQKGRSFIGVPGEEKNPAKWTITDRSKVVTFRDGYVKKSNHNYDPSKAIDVAPWPIDWKDMNRFFYLAGIVMTISEQFYKAGKIEKRLKWGHDWDGDLEFDDHSFVDAPHFEVIDE